MASDLAGTSLLCRIGYHYSWISHIFMDEGKEIEYRVINSSITTALIVLILVGFNLFLNDFQ